MRTMGHLTSGVAPQGSARAIVARGVIVQALRFRVVLSWAGGILAALGALAMVLGAGWGSPEAVALSGAYGAAGAFMVLGGAVRR